LPKETNQRKGSRSLGPPVADYPVLLIKTGRCETRPTKVGLRQSSRYFRHFFKARQSDDGHEKTKKYIKKT